MPLRFKIRGLSLLCILALCLSGCTLLTELYASQPMHSATKYLEQIEDSWRYQRLNPTLQECYGTVYTALTDEFSNDTSVTLADNSHGTPQAGLTITLPHPLTSQNQAQQLYNAIVYDNPHFFYISNHYGLEGYEQNDIPQYTKILLTYTMDVTTRNEAKKQLDARLDDIRQASPASPDDYIIEDYLHDRLVTQCEYHHDAAKDGFEKYPNAYSAYGALVEKRAVCEGYSRAMQLLLKQHGIGGTLVIGEAIDSGEQHMWNFVRINNEYYHLDVTWNDSEETPRHNYFNVTTAQISLSHRIHADKSPIEECNATKDNYYIRNGLFVDTYRRQDIASIIASRIRAGDTQIELFFAADKFDSALLFLKNYTATAELVNPYLAGSGRTLWKYRLFGETDEHILTIIKK